MSSTRILESDQIERKLQRIARQIIEEFHTEDVLHLITIAGNGEPVGKRIGEIIEAVGGLQVQASVLTLNKSNPLEGDIALSVASETLSGQSVIVLDDVLNSGKTLMYAVHHILSAGPKRVATAVLIDRIHRSFPVRADFCGLTLSTNLKEHIEVSIEASASASDAATLHD
ncbi:MAG: phosphoribosyltransferase family protein [Flavobacteriales bacterium]